MDKYKYQLYQVYLWARDDYYSLIKYFFFMNQESRLIKDNEYIKQRLLWKNYFKRYPKKWPYLKSILKKSFEMDKHEDYYCCFNFFINNILTDKSCLLPKEDIYIYNILTKIFLDRLFLFFSIFYPKINSIECSPNKHIYYKKLILHPKF